MTKKDQLQAELKEKIKAGIKPSQIRKSKSLESLTTKSPNKQITDLENQVKFESQKAQNYLEQLTKLTAEVDSKEQVIKELTTEKNKLTDQNNELRINNLQQRDYFSKYQAESKLNNQLKLQVSQLQKDLTITQQDLKSAQGIIELRLTKTDGKNRQELDYWPWIRMGSLVLLIYLLSKEK
jgi:hypothetical protein